MRALFILLAISSTNVLFGQTGPAGVGTSSNNVLWLKADFGTNTVVNGGAVNSWQDASGNTNNASQAIAGRQPSYGASVMNGMPALFFDNLNSPNNDELVITDNSNLDNTNGLTILAVVRPTSINGDARAIVSKRNNAGVDQSYTIFFYTSSRLFIDIDGNTNRFNGNTTYVGVADYLVTVRYDGTVSAATRVIDFVNGNNDITSSESSSSIPDNASPITIGSMNIGDGRPFGGYIAEVIIYRKALLPVERIIAHSYLFAKYGLSSSSTPAAAFDFYTGDDAANGNYDFEVAGVGVDAVGNANSAASSSVSGGLGISQVSGYDNGDYLVFGHAAGGVATQITDVGGMTGTNNARWTRVWYFDVTNTSTNQVANISFDMSDAGQAGLTPVTASNYVLLQRAGQSGNWTEVATASSIVGDQINFPGVTVAADGYYTLGSKNYIASPLPITLVEFTGEATEKGVELRWTTATEHNNDFFTIERSSDGYDFSPIAKIDGAGTTVKENSYTILDTNPSIDRTYYRLVQTDFNGRSAKLKTIAVTSFERSRTIEVIPNPSNGSFWFELPAGGVNSDLKIMNSAGNTMPFTHSQLGTKVNVDAQALPKGLYFLMLVNDRGMHTAKFVIE